METNLPDAYALLLARLIALEAKVEALEMLTTLMRDELYEMRDGALEDADVVTETVYDYMAEHDGWNEPET